MGARVGFAAETRPATGSGPDTGDAPPASGEARKRRVAWQCRRGMRELDLLLLGFVERHYDELDEPRRRAFETLLAHEDQLLLTYLMGRAQPLDPHLAEVVQEIRGTSRH